MYVRLLLAAASATTLSVAPVKAEDRVCGPRNAIVEKLERDYTERRKGVGIRDRSAIFEVYVSDETGSWTILMTKTDGVSCVMAVGEDWRDDAGEPLARIGDPV